jgi:hypothetical protein
MSRLVAYIRGRGKGIVTFGVGILLVADIAVGRLQLSPPEVQPVNSEEAVENEGEAVGEEHLLSVGVRADGWDADTSSPVIAHVVSEAERVDYYHAYAANEEVSLKVPAKGGYEVSFVSPINADGSVYRVPEAETVDSEVADEGSDADARPVLSFTFERVNAADVTQEELADLVEQVTDAVRNGDETLTGESGIKVVETVTENAKANNPNADANAVGRESAEATEAAQSGTSSAQTGTVSGDSSTSGGSGSTGSPSGGQASGGSAGASNGSGSASNSGSSGSASGSGGESSSPATPAHVHSWVAQAETVHRDAVYATVHHDAVYENRSICNVCGADITGNTTAHMKAHALAGDSNGKGSYRNERVTVQAAYDEQVVSQAAYDETVTTGYVCSGCGATK